MNEATDPRGVQPGQDKFLAQMEREFIGWDDPSARILQALERGDFALFAQPILALKGEPRFELAELLVRLREEEAAMLPPGEFFPVFEHFGMMPQLDRWVTRRAIDRLARGSKVARFSINVSGQTLRDDRFAADVAAEVKRAGVDAGLLVFEIDESDILAQPQPSARFAASVKQLGCRIAIDSFGQRGVSFTPLKDLNADFVKVDGSIVRKLASSEVARTKLRAVARVGEVVGVGVVAGCVEEGEILDRVKAAGADYAQGFGIRRPAPLDAVAEGDR